MKQTKLCELLGIEYPIIQAPMNWITGAELASAVSNAGGLGVLGPNAGAKEETDDVIETGERLRQEIRKTKSLTNKPFAVNLMSASADLRPGSKPFSEQCMKVVLEERVSSVVLSGDAPELYAQRLKDAGIAVLFRALPVNFEIAKKAELSGIDVFIAVGHEGGGHTGFYRIPTFVLVPQVVNALKIPVVAGGGIADGKGMAAALALGAQGVFIGTAFMVAQECPVHDNVKQAIVDADDTCTTTLDGLSGVLLRAMNTPLIQRCLQMKAEGFSLEEITIAYRAGYRKGMLEGDSAEGTFVFGCSAGLINERKSASDIIRSMVAETEEIIKTL